MKFISLGGGGGLTDESVSTGVIRIGLSSIGGIVMSTQKIMKT